MSDLVKPPALKKGDVVGILCPSSPPSDPEMIERCVKALKSLGYRPRTGGNVANRNGFLAGSDADRLDDLHSMFRDPEVRAVFCVRGGYGLTRILNSMDFDLIQSQPKIFIGFSDVTALHCAVSRYSDLMTFHGPTLAEYFVEQGTDSDSVRFCLDMLSGDCNGFSLKEYFPSSCPISYRKGKVEAPLVGGNLCVLTHLIGTRFQPEVSGKILFFEEVHEVPYRLDRMLTQWLDTGFLDGVAGIAVGELHRCRDPLSGETEEYRQTAMEVFEERLSGLNIPIVFNLPFGHGKRNATLPVGGRAVLDGDQGDLYVASPELPSGSISIGQSR